MAHSDHSEYREEIYGEQSHVYDRSEPRYSIVAILGVITAISLVFVGIGIQFYYERVEQSQVYEQVLAQPNWVLDNLRRKEAAELNGYGYVDEKKTAVRIPISEAMKLIAQESAENRMKYPTSPYAKKSETELAGSPAVSAAGAAAVQATQQSGITSSPHVQQSSQPQQPHK